MHGQPLPAGLQESDRLPEPVFTPSTKADVGLHDENISFEQAVAIVGRRRRRARPPPSAWPPTSGPPTDAAERGIIIADTKFELGWIDGELALCDEVLTPDSSRFWEAADWQPGTDPAVVRQAAGAGLAGGHRLGQEPAAAAAPARRGRRHRAPATSPPTSASPGKSLADWPGVQG